MERKFGILIVDDDVNLASTLQDILNEAGYNAAVAGDGQTALTLCREQVFDLALIDIKLPDTPGMKLINELVKLSFVMEYIIITGYAALDSAVEAVRQRSIIAYEVKPLDMEHLLSLIRQVTERKRAEETLQQKIRELTALNNLFVTYLNQGFAVAETHDRLASSIIKMAEEIQELAKEAEARQVKVETSPAEGGEDSQ